MEKDTLRVPALKIGDHSQNMFGGIVAGWKGEGLPASDTAPKLRELNFSAAKLFLYSTATNELVADSGIVTVLQNAFRLAASHFMDDAFLAGDGGGKPQGILHHGNGALLTVNRNTANTIKYIDLCTMLAKLTPASFAKAEWVCHPSTLSALSSLIIYDGATAVDHYPLIGTGGKMTLLSRPVIITEKCGKLGSNYDLALIDFSQYGVGMRSDLTLQSNEGELFSRDTTAFRLVIRTDGMPMWSESLTLKDGVSKVSPFVALI
jgi:HK97 family phage major capsid protein